MRHVFFFIIFCFCSVLSFAQKPLRKAFIGLQIKSVIEGVRIDSVYLNSTGSALNLKKNDIIISINNTEIKTNETFSSTVSQIRVGDKIEVKVLRSGKVIRCNTKALIRPFEQSETADVIYDWVKFKDGYLRTITRKPKGKTNLPCILLIPGYGCGSIEAYSAGYNGRIINEWVKSGYAIVTIEKSGMGDSYNCAPCTEVDMITDIESFNAGYDYMENLDFIDKNNLFVWGHSMGGVIAPEIAKRHKPKGVMVFATVFRPWSEFLLEMHRVQKPLLEGLSYQQTETFVRLIQKVYYEFFVLKKTPAQLYANPEYKNMVASEMEYKENSSNMWGRHWRFWQQIDSLNLAVSWKELNCSVLVLNGGADYEQCAPIEPILIEETVNASHPGNATRIQIEDIDHFMMKSSNFKEALENFNNKAYTKGNFNSRIATETINWLNKNSKKN